MSLFNILSTIFIGPLKLAFEIIYVVANKFINHPGLSIIVLSLIMNFLVLPLYKRADAMQEAARDIDAKLHKGVAHIKKTFSGDERMMILQAYYRENNYKPTDALNGSISLLLEVPFFMAAYQFLSHLDMIQGVSLGPIANLGAPDGMLVIGSLTINVLPVLMTLVNVISSAIYLKGFPLKTKIQLYAMALFFLVFLYTSPSGLVFYWTLNNVFSLVKTIFYKLKNPRKVLAVLASLAGVFFLYQGFVGFNGSKMKQLALILVGAALMLPLLKSLVDKKLPAIGDKKIAQPNKKFFVMGCMLMTVLVGVLIPSTFIAASPQEYIDLTYFHNPMLYILQSACLAAGLFLVWMGVFYWLASPSGKVWFEKGVWVLCGVMLVNYMFFGTDLGILSSNLQYERGLHFSTVEMATNLGILLVVALILNLVHAKWSKSLSIVLLTGIIALGGMSVLNVNKITGPVKEAEVQAETIKENSIGFDLSTEGQNVVVIMLDRALNEYIPYIMAEKPELQKQFSGFTYYANTVSMGGCTNFATPALFGGYEYTPVEINKRDTESLTSKQNEALLMMPVLFDQNGYEVTVCDPPYANYSYVSDTSIYEPYPDIKAYVTEGNFDDIQTKVNVIESNTRNFFCFSLMKTMPLVIQPVWYDYGNYNNSSAGIGDEVYGTQTILSDTVANGISSLFMRAYNVLVNLSNITNVTEENKNTFLLMTNNTTHEPMLLQEPAYVPAEYVDNTAYYKDVNARFTLNGRTMKMHSWYQISHYQSNVATLIQLGNWFDYLRESGVYDNTRIILVSDHGRELYQFDELVMDDGEDPVKGVEFYYPLFMVKDFESSEFTTSYEFMTNADTATLAVEGLIENPVNPFSGKIINNDAKDNGVYIIASQEFDVNSHGTNTFNASKWAKVKDNLWEKDNWTFYDSYTLLPPDLMS